MKNQNQKTEYLCISFPEKELYILNELNQRSSDDLDYVSKSGLARNLIKKGLLYEQEHNPSKTRSSL